MNRTRATKLEAMQLDIVGGIESQIGKPVEDPLDSHSHLLTTEPLTQAAMDSESKGDMSSLFGRGRSRPDRPSAFHTGWPNVGHR